MQRLSDAELNIMMKFWERNSPMTLEEVQDAVVHYNWTDNTVRNFLTRIVNKGFLRIDKLGRKNLYVQLVSDEYIDKKSKSLLEKLYDDSLQHFVAGLYESDSLTKEDILELRDYLDDILKEEE
ncbi:MAG: BlaI/MecI/CopY family transcriptional regulator [Tissierellales bacterium]